MSAWSAVLPMVWLTSCMVLSTSANFATAMPPTATRGTVSFCVRFVPISVTLPPTSLIFSPAACICEPNTDAADADCDSRLFNWFSVSIISRCKASYFSCPISSGVTFSAVSLSVWRRPRVSSTAFLSSPCFCVSSSVLDGSSLSSLLTSLRDDCVFLRLESTLFSDCSSFVVSPPISIVIPLILPAAINCSC